MYMRYAGGGVGHYRVTLTDTPANANDIQEDFAVEDDVTAMAGLEEVEEAERIQDDNIEDHCSDLESGSESEEDDEENPDEDDLGAEDGEGGFLDVEDDEGYAAL
jgi:hypothetical protein